MSDNTDSAMHAEKDAYFTISAPVDAEIKIQGSRFLSYAVPVRDAEQFMAYLDTLKKEHYNATHHCYAYRVGLDSEHFRYNDDGEPSGTAGKRILGAIDRHEITDTGIVVVRYFGGTKLGVGGLGRAYADSAEEVLQRAEVVERIITAEFTVEFPFDLTSQVHHLLEQSGASVTDRVYAETVQYRCNVRKSHIGRCVEDLLEGTKHAVTVTPLPP
jgi:uncharacterized YigZ family protein